ncbi:putative host cell division inhibitor [Rahnella phage Sarma103]|nr:putative host cell division inhibitor [Rahnella phage Sarma103]
MLTYGLTKQTLCTYQMAVAHGYSWASAMTALKALYEHNKEFANGGTACTR